MLPWILRWSQEVSNCGTLLCASIAQCPSPDVTCRDAAILESHAAAVSNLTRSILERSHGRPQLRHTTALPHNPTHLVTAAGGVLTMRLAQVVLAGYNAKLPGADRCDWRGLWYIQLIL
jgi:hypothetical protein